jgi:hypothetical protein
MTIQPQWLVIGLLVWMFLDIMRGEGLGAALKFVLLGLPILVVFATVVLIPFGYEHLPGEFLAWLFQ